MHLLSRPSVLGLALAPLTLASPFYPRQQFNDTNENCFAQTSAISEWQISDLDFHASYIFSTPAHQNSWGYVNFTLYNPVLETSTRCSASSNRLNDFFYGEVSYECEDGGENASYADKADLRDTSFAFSRPSGVVTVEQSWYCRDDPQFPSTLTAKGDGTADLDCEETFWQNGNWTIGQIYSQRDVTCDLVDLSVPVKEVSAVA